MRISELSKISGVPIATVKFYLREKLLPPGTPIGRNQADYDESHLRRIVFIRALTNVGRLDISSVRRLIQAIEEEQSTLNDLYDSANRAVWPIESESPRTPVAMQTGADVADLVERLGWETAANSPGYIRFATALETLRKLGCTCDIEYFVPYAEAAERLMAQELSLLPDELGGPDRAVAVARTILIGIAMTSLSNMAQTHLLAQRQSSATATEDRPPRRNPTGESPDRPRSHSRPPHHTEA